MTYLLFVVFERYRSLMSLPLVAVFDPFVAVECAWLRERLRADVAFVWSGSAVDSQVYEQVQFLDGCHAAARVLAVIVPRVPFGSLVQDPLDWVHIDKFLLFVFVVRLWSFCWFLFLHSSCGSCFFIRLRFMINLTTVRALLEARFIRIVRAFSQLIL